MRQLPLVFLCLCLSSVAVQAEVTSASLIVQITGIDPQAGGQLRVLLYRGAETWLKADAALAQQQLPVSTATAQLEFRQLPPGAGYAVQAHHDQNANGKLDMRWLPYPKPREGFGISNNDPGFGHPDFSAASFFLRAGEQQISIQLSY